GIVRITAKPAAALLLHHADDHEANPLDPDGLSDRLGGVEEVLRGLRSETGNALQRFHLGLRKEAPISYRMILDDRIVLTHTLYAGCLIPVVRLDLCIAADTGHDPCDRRASAQNGDSVLQLQSADGTE